MSLYQRIIFCARRTPERFPSAIRFDYIKCNYLPTPSTDTGTLGQISCRPQRRFDGSEIRRVSKKREDAKERHQKNVGMFVSRDSVNLNNRTRLKYKQQLPSYIFEPSERVPENIIRHTSINDKHQTRNVQTRCELITKLNTIVRRDVQTEELQWLGHTAASF